MKSLIDYIKECCDFANPMNTTGMGNPSGPDANGIASEPLVTGRPHKLKKVKKKSIKESLEDNLIWKLSKWFERNEQQEQEFINLMISCKKGNFNIKDIEENLQGTSLYDNLKEFVNFILDDLELNKDKDYIYQLKKILESAKNNKSKNNKYQLV